MKKEYFNRILLAVAVTMCVGCVNVPSNKFLIEGKLTNVPDSTVIGLYEIAGNLFVERQQDTLLNGKFSFSDTLSAKKCLVIISRAEGFPNHWLDVWVAPGRSVEIIGQDKLLKTWSVMSDIAEQKDENNYAAVTAELTKKWMELSAKETVWLRKLNNPKYDDKEVWAKIDSLRELEDPLKLEIYRLELEYMQTAPITLVWLERLQEYASFLPYEDLMPYKKELESLYARLSETEKQTPQAQAADAYLHPLSIVEVGDEMVDGNLYDVDGNLHHLSELKGKYILLDFWSQGCGPCVQSIPEMEKLIEQYKDKLSVVGISEDSKAQWEKYVKEKKMKGYQWNELSSALRVGLGRRYQVRGIPHYVLINPEGKIIDMWRGYAPGSLEYELSEHLK